MVPGFPFIRMDVEVWKQSAELGCEREHTLLKEEPGNHFLLVGTFQHVFTKLALPIAWRWVLRAAMLEVEIIYSF